MRTTSKLAAAALGTALFAPVLGAGVAQAAAAADGNTMATLKPVPLNGVKGNGMAMVTVKGNTLDVTIAASGLLADNPHAAHIHTSPEARHECPTAADDTSGDGTITTSEGVPAYGSVVVSLTKTGDTSPTSALAVDRFDTAPGGKINYERGSIQVSDAVAAAVSKGDAFIVVHGVDYNGNGAYDGETKSDLDPSLPAEATDPALCGMLAAAPAGGVQTGGGGSSAPADGLRLALGGGILLAALGTGGFAARKARNRI